MVCLMLSTRWMGVNWLDSPISFVLSMSAQFDFEWKSTLLRARMVEHTLFHSINNSIVNLKYCCLVKQFATLSIMHKMSYVNLHTFPVAVLIKVNQFRFSHCRQSRAILALTLWHSYYGAGHAMDLARDIFRTVTVLPCVKVTFVGK